MWNKTEQNLISLQDSDQLVKRKRLESLAAQLGRELQENGGVGNTLTELIHLVQSRTDSRLK
jgi:hypothetical protein